VKEVDPVGIVKIQEPLTGLRIYGEMVQGLTVMWLLYTGILLSQLWMFLSGYSVF